MSEITIQVNGDNFSCPQDITLLKLLDKLGFNPRLVAIEYNGEILHRQYWTETKLKANDHLEIVTIVGGG